MGLFNQQAQLGGSIFKKDIYGYWVNPIPYAAFVEYGPTFARTESPSAFTYEHHGSHMGINYSQQYMLL